MNRRFWINRLLVLSLCLPFVQCIWRRTVTTQPAVTVKVVDAAGAPVAGAEVVVWWWSYPHSVVHERYAASSGADGSAVFAGASKGETIAPLCMHGVPQHEHTVCVDVAGKGRGVVELEKSGETVTITLQPADAGGAPPANGRCEEFANEWKAKAAQAAPSSATP
ncbi:MAG TPA: hypothetical protein VM261_18730 [Kofleriaceae bacterium]|nr:hypothetical protein [Kofleriaceae bacterium]